MPAPRWMSQAASEEFSWSQTLGGTRGVIETSAPGLIFVIVYVATHALVPTLVAASAVAVIACIIRLIQRQSTQQAVSGFFGVAVGVILAAATGRGENYFAWGIVTNLAMAAAFALSVLARRSLVGFFYAMLTGLPTGWQRDPSLRPPPPPLRPAHVDVGGFVWPARRRPSPPVGRRRGRGTRHRQARLGSAALRARCLGHLVGPARLLLVLRLLFRGRGRYGLAQLIQSRRIRIRHQQQQLVRGLEYVIGAGSERTPIAQ